MNVVYVGERCLLHGFRTALRRERNIRRTGNDPECWRICLRHCAARFTPRPMWISRTRRRAHFSSTHARTGDLFYGNAWHSWVAGVWAGRFPRSSLGCHQTRRRHFTEANAEPRDRRVDIRQHRLHQRGRLRQQARQPMAPPDTPLHDASGGDFRQRNTASPRRCGIFL